MKECLCLVNQVNKDQRYFTTLVQQNWWAAERHWLSSLANQTLTSKSYRFCFPQSWRSAAQAGDDPQSSAGIAGENDRYTGWKFWRKMVMSRFIITLIFSFFFFLIKLLCYITSSFTSPRPLWLSPAQVMVIPVGGNSESYAKQVSARWRFAYCTSAVFFLSAFVKSLCHS